MAHWLSIYLPPMWPGFDSRTRRHMWVESVVGSRPCSERFFSGCSGYPLSSKTNISKFQFDLDYCQNTLSRASAREIAQALPVLLTLNKLHLHSQLHCALYPRTTVVYCSFFELNPCSIIKFFQVLYI